MTGRVLLGKRGSDHGLFVSQSGINVTDTSSTTPLSFDSRAVRGLVISAKGEDSLPPGASNSGSIDNPTSDTISHGLGYIPLVAVRWCLVADLTSSVATQMYSPFDYRREELETGGDDDEEEANAIEEWGCSLVVNSSNLIIYNHCFGSSQEGDFGEHFGTGKETIYYAYIIFKAKDITGGNGI